MAVREILIGGDPILRKKSKLVKKVDKKIKNLIRDLEDTLAAQYDPEGVGLAAPQIGKNLRVFIVRPGKKMVVMINPELLKVSKKHKVGGENKKNAILEGCLSLPHYYGPLTRSGEIEVKYLDENGIERNEVFTGFPAQIVLHEIDHLNGKLFVDRLLEQKKKLYELVSGEWEEVDLIL